MFFAFLELFCVIQLDRHPAVSLDYCLAMLVIIPESPCCDTICGQNIVIRIVS